MRRSKQGFTLVELLVVIAIIGVLVALLLPAIQAAREAARRTQCNNNLKNLGLALQNYHDTYKVFPMGAMPARVGATGGPVLGPSWWYGILPFIEQRNIYDKIAATQRSGVAAPIFTEGSMRGAAGIGQNTISQLMPEVMRCPSSPLPPMETQSGPIALPTYVGISGGCDITNSTGALDYQGGTPAIPANFRPTSNRVYINQHKGSAPNGAIVTNSGMLPPAQHINIAGCSDGTSNTAIVSEQSDWLRDTTTTISTAYHGDPGWNDGTTFTPASGSAGTLGTAIAGGWLSGMETPTTQVTGISGTLDTTNGNAAGAWTTTGMFNLTTVRYRADLKRVLTGGGAGYPGCAQVLGHNNPLQSPHPGGVLIAFVDGSVQFISGTQDFAILLRIAIRDDGQNVTLDN